ATSFTFTAGEWLRTPRFDVNIFLNDRLTPETRKAIWTANQRFYFITLSPEHVTELLKSRMDVRMESEMAKTIRINVKDVNADKATDIVNAITLELLNYDVER